MEQVAKILGDWMHLAHSDRIRDGLRRAFGADPAPLPAEMEELLQHLQKDEVALDQTATLDGNRGRRSDPNLSAEPAPPEDQIPRCG